MAALYGCYAWRLFAEFTEHLIEVFVILVLKLVHPCDRCFAEEPDRGVFVSLRSLGDIGTLSAAGKVGDFPVAEPKEVLRHALDAAIIVHSYKIKYAEIEVVDDEGDVTIPDLVEKIVKVLVHVRPDHDAAGGIFEEIDQLKPLLSAINGKDRRKSCFREFADVMRGFDQGMRNHLFPIQRVGAEYGQRYAGSLLLRRTRHVEFVPLSSQATLGDQAGQRLIDRRPPHAEEFGKLPLRRQAISRL